MKTITEILIRLSLMGLTLMPVIGCNSSSNGNSTTSGDLTAVDSETKDSSTVKLTYPVVDTGQSACYDDDGAKITCPGTGEAFAGQDAQYVGLQPSYTDNGDGTVTDNVTGLVWQQIPANSGLNYQEAEAYCESLELGGYDDWRIPTTKELFSISNVSKGWPYLDTTYFNLAGSSVSKDEQYWTQYYVGTTVEGGSEAAFGVNHGTGHIKAYPATVSGPMGNYVRAVRGNSSYGVNDFEKNGDGTVTDHATGLMWQQANSKTVMDWKDALAYAENLTEGGYSDWRLPTVKELQSIVDYTHSPSTGDAANLGPAIDTDFFDITALASGTTDYDPDYGYFWTSTSAYFGEDSPEYYYAWYVAFGSAVGQDGADFHGAGAVRFDTKYEGGALGEGGERYYNYVRCVRDVESGVSKNSSDDNGLAYEPFINSIVFDFAYGDTETGERLIDSQYASTAYYNMDETGSDPGNMFGVNFADGRIKGYGLNLAGADKTFFVIYVRDNKATNYGVNNFRDNGDGTITDLSTGLMWMQDDSGYGMEWQDALAYCEDLEYASHTDWRLPNAKELQSIVDYTRMPDATDNTTPSTPGAAIDTNFFNITPFTNYNGDEDWGFFWSASTHKSSNGNGGWGAYIAFGRALGYMGDGWVDIHGAGCERSDPKYDDGTDYSEGHGPQGDAVYVYNYVRPVCYDETVTNPTYVVVDTNQNTYWDNTSEISAPAQGETFYGQDAQYNGIQASYTDNGNGTVTDNNTGLMWQKSPDTNGDGDILSNDKYSYDEAMVNASACTTGGYTDWRLPTIKELYSLMQFSGEDVSSESLGDTEAGMDMPIDDGSDGEEPAGTIVDTSSDMAAPELDFNAGVDYLSGLGVTMTAADLEAVFGSPPPPLAEELAQALNITIQQAETLMNDYLGLPDLDLGMSSM
ncbi:conserved hypothetical protein [Desulforapulum autotrophicum HRM2]|uniref:Lcl C-terminal domain-containing protein n=1 Tax=Desulforapulum autotrophicum (strain ATCC 43914 / DSM 3382 / VKM B-1955 / HRM2) TaxID=177437 RepID=C0QG15_DESAH|nr:DUF1566 domain-containing protein [Desulforapulum autotrophicum]ACN17594.1 conserved hypothetical protein [Desulforapulum autotrophicum HRM2]